MPAPVCFDSTIFLQNPSQKKKSYLLFAPFALDLKSLQLSDKPTEMVSGCCAFPETSDCKPARGTRGPICPGTPRFPLEVLHSVAGEEEVQNSLSSPVAAPSCSTPDGPDDLSAEESGPSFKPKLSLYCQTNRRRCCGRRGRSFKRGAVVTIRAGGDGSMLRKKIPAENHQFVNHGCTDSSPIEGSWNSS